MSITASPDTNTEADEMADYSSDEFQPTEHADIVEAFSNAVREAGAVGGRIFPCVVFKQGRRTMVSTSFPLLFIRRHVVSESAEKGGSPRERTNRPLIPEHAKSIHQYLLANPADYILPPVTLNTDSMPSLHVQKASGAPTRLGYIVVHDGTRFHVTDGQHRLAALAGYSQGRTHVPGALSDNAKLAEDGLAVLIVIESDRARIQQDFADAAQTKQIPASLLAVYNTREPVNQVLARITEESKLLHGRIDEVGKTLPKASQKLFLLNQIRGMVKSLLFGDYALAEDTLSRMAATRLATQEQRDEFVTETLIMLGVLTELMQPWSEIAQLPTSGSGADKIVALREKFVNLTATGINVIGTVVYEINRQTTDPEQRAAYYRKLATEIKWQRSADIWANNVVVPDGKHGKIATNRGPVSAAVRNVKRAIGLIVEAEAASTAGAPSEATVPDQYRLNDTGAQLAGPSQN
ncbi:DNA sulfur modification protein DndB [Micromonospora sp. LH3U1]|uniref:DNA sulfur modification protein DndB n=1 Tax=Micromonospora sp. LH3U1 TaxID=3018339 RepID=UPI00234B80C1|nr:DNA sulfur modification protein DndB [Micromonospora sp. LH3U1]WCN82515.1 DNA sulfur modification protein DndB [Micromonospora sp. LH3U1]